MGVMRVIFVACASCVCAFCFNGVGAYADIVTVTRPPASGFSDFGILTPWTNANNATTDDGAYAANALSTSGTSNPLDASIFGFNLPSDVTIVGIEVTVDARDPLATGSVTTSVVDLQTGGSPVHFGFASGREDGAPWPGTDTLFTYGGPTDLWDRSWTPSEISVGFHALITAQTTGGGQAEVDAVWVTVHYFDPGLQGGSLSAQTIGSVPAPGFFSGSGGPWTNPSAAAVSDNVSTVSSTDVVFDGMSVFFLTEELRLQNFGFDIPSNATIDGIELKIERRASNTNVIDAAISLYKQGVRVHGPNGQSLREGPNWTTIDEVRSYGSTIDLWDTTWTPEDINDPSFGVSFAAANGSSSEDAFVDRVEVRVHYTPGVASQGPLFSEGFSASGGADTDRTWGTTSGTPMVSAGALQPGSWTAVTNSGVAGFADGTAVNFEFDIVVPSFAAGSSFTYGWRNTAGDSLEVTVNTDSSQPPLTVSVNGAGSSMASFGSPGALVAGTTYHVSVAFEPANSTDITAFMLAASGPGGDIVEGAVTNVATNIPAGLGATGGPFVSQQSTGTTDNLEISAGTVGPVPAGSVWASWVLAGALVLAGFGLIRHGAAKAALRRP